MTKIDFHTHCFPDRLASRAIQTLSDKSGGILPYFDGTAAGLSALLKKSGVDFGVVQSIATNEHQMRAVNDFAKTVLDNSNLNLYAFGSVYPKSEHALDEARRVKELGLCGIKFHPDYQGFYPDDESIFSLYEEINRLNLPVLFHAGEDYGFKPPYHGMPNRLIKALSVLKVPVIFAHFGGIGCAEEVIESDCELPVFLDTSFASHGIVTKEQALKIIRKHGADKILFGSDAPWSDPNDEVNFIESLGLSEREKELIFNENAKKILKIKG